MQLFLYVEIYLYILAAYYIGIVIGLFIAISTSYLFHKKFLIERKKNIIQSEKLVLHLKDLKRVNKFYSAFTN